YDDGFGVEKDTKEALRLYRLAAAQGHVRAQYALAQCYDDGRGVEKDEKLAKQLYTPIHRDCKGARFNLATFYGIGSGRKKKLHLLPKKKDEFYHSLVRDYMYTKDAEKTKAALWLLATLYEDKNAQFDLAAYYESSDENGKEKKPDFEAAFRYYKLAAAAGLKDAQYKMGLYYEKGQGVKQDLKKAILSYQLAAEQGQADAQR